MKRLSVIVVSFNTENILRQSLQSLQSQLDFNQDELIVVDNNSSDHTIEMLHKEFPLVKLIALDKNYGYAFAVNKGIEQASSFYLLVSNSDIIFPENSVYLLFEKISGQSKAGVVCPELIDFDGSCKQLTWQWEVNLGGEFLNKLFSPKSIARHKVVRSLITSLQRKERVVSWVSGAAFIISRKVMDIVGGFDANFQLFYEDSDLFARVRTAGYSIIFTPQIKVIHGLGESCKDQWSKLNLIFIQSRLYYYRKHLSSSQHFLLKLFLKMRFLFSREYRNRRQFQYWVDLILSEQKTIPIWTVFEI